MSTKTVGKGSKIVRYLKAPARILARARDFYVNSMMRCAGHVGQSSAIGCSAPQFSTLPRSFSVGSSYSTGSEEDLRELIRVASTRSLGGKIESELLRAKRPSPLRVGGGVAVVPRSHTVAIGRIDEDKPCEFGVHEVDSVPRSRTYAGWRGKSSHINNRNLNLPKEVIGGRCTNYGNLANVILPHVNVKEILLFIIFWKSEI
ncbi:uncharacterized protein [Henckelia pumila]|uniref:uncharacterized protein n=1 Tax=Henckelia pumila TaxID=405737 RepID=UPI003C6DE634